MGQETQKDAQDFDITEVGLYDPLTYDRSEGDNTDPGETGDQTKDTSPNDGSKSPDGDQKPNNGQDGELQLGQEEVAKLREVLDRAGFKSMDAFIENYVEQRRIIPELKHTLNTYDAKFAELESKIRTTQEPPKPPEKEYTDEELAVMMAEKPKEFIAFMTGQMIKALTETGPLKDLSTKLGNIERDSARDRSDRLLIDIRRDYPDFKDYENDIDRQLQAMGSSLKGMQSEGILLMLYENLKYRKENTSLADTVKKLKAGEQIIDDKAKDASALGNANGKGSGDTMSDRTKPDKGKEKIKTPVGELSREDLDLVYDPTGAYMSSLKPISSR